MIAIELEGLVGQGRSLDSAGYYFPATAEISRLNLRTMLTNPLVEPRNSRDAWHASFDRQGPKR